MENSSFQKGFPSDDVLRQDYIIHSWPIIVRIRSVVFLGSPVPETTNNSVLEVRQRPRFCHPLVQLSERGVPLALCSRGGTDDYVGCVFKGGASGAFGVVLEIITLEDFSDGCKS